MRFGQKENGANESRKERKKERKKEKYVKKKNHLHLKCKRLENEESLPF